MWVYQLQLIATKRSSVSHHLSTASTFAHQSGRHWCPCCPLVLSRPVHGLCPTNRMGLASLPIGKTLLMAQEPTDHRWLSFWKTSYHGWGVGFSWMKESWGGSHKLELCSSEFQLWVGITRCCRVCSSRLAVHSLVYYHFLVNLKCGVIKTWILSLALP